VGSRLRLGESLDINRIDVDSSFDVWNLSGGVRYFKINDGDEGIALGGRFKVTDRISIIGDQQRNIALKENIRLSLGLAYQDDCSFFSLSYERSGGRDRTLGPSESIRFNFVLTGLGGVSDSSYD
jgi:LPS-assembly protein